MSVHVATLIMKIYLNNNGVICDCALKRKRYCSCKFLQNEDGVVLKKKKSKRFYLCN